jgi:uncharacterized protein YxjI
MTSTPANWYPDPTGRHQLRYWNGEHWTEHVSNAGQPAVDHLDGTQPVALGVTPQQIRAQVTGTGSRGAALGDGPAGAGTIWSEPVLVVNQKMKVIELTNQYAVFDRQGNQLASVTQVGQSTARKVLRAITSLDQFLTHQLEIRDASGRVQLVLTRPAKVMKSTVIVADASGNGIGEIVQENMFGKIRFGLHAGGTRIGTIHAENWRAWNFRIEDAAGNEVARITKTFEGLARTLFTTADNYVVQLHGTIAQPLLSMVVASALSVDTALKQDARGLS